MEGINMEDHFWNHSHETHHVIATATRFFRHSTLTQPTLINNAHNPEPTASKRIL